MELIDFRFQIALFGNFDDISPNLETIKYFLEAFADKGFIPSQYSEISLDIVEGPKANLPRLSLTSNDSSWNIRFSNDRVDFILTNINIGVFEMLTKESFLKEFEEIYKKINKQFPKKIKRIGFVNHYLIKGLELKSVSKKLNNLPDFFNETPTIELIHKIANRTTIKVPEDEIINVSVELKKLKTKMRINNKPSDFDGLIFRIDLNTLSDRNDYRFFNENIVTTLNESSKIEEIVKNGYLQKLQ